MLLSALLLLCSVFSEKDERMYNEIRGSDEGQVGQGVRKLVRY